MPRPLIAAALATAIAIAFIPALALAHDDPEVFEKTDIGVGPPLSIDTVFDLGVDVSNVPNTPAAAKAFLLGLPPASQSILVATCAHYLQAPARVRSRDTIEFCQNVRG